MIDFLGTYLPEFFYALCGLVSLILHIVQRKMKKRV